MWSFLLANRWLFTGMFAVQAKVIAKDWFVWLLLLAKVSFFFFCQAFGWRFQNEIGKREAAENIFFRNIVYLSGPLSDETLGDWWPYCMGILSTGPLVLKWLGMGFACTTYQIWSVDILSAHLGFYLLTYKPWAVRNSSWTAIVESSVSISCHCR